MGSFPIVSCHLGRLVVEAFPFSESLSGLQADSRALPPASGCQTIDHGVAEMCLRMQLKAYSITPAGHGRGLPLESDLKPESKKHRRKESFSTSPPFPLKSLRCCGCEAVPANRHLKRLERPSVSAGASVTHAHGCEVFQKNVKTMTFGDLDWSCLPC